MTLLQKIQNLIWFNNVAKLKEILIGINTKADSIDSRLTIVESTPSSVPSYKVYSALLTQTGTNAPVVSVLENTIGNIVWSRESIGVYLATLNGAFTANKSVSPCWQNIGVFYDNSGLTRFNLVRNNINSMRLTSATDILPEDSWFYNEYVEIRIYN